MKLSTMWLSRYRTKSAITSSCQSEDDDDDDDDDDENDDDDQSANMVMQRGLLLGEIQPARQQR